MNIQLKVNTIILVLIMQAQMIDFASAELNSKPTPIKPYRFGQPTTMKTSVQRLQKDPHNGTVTLIKGNLYASSDVIEVSRHNKDKTLYQEISLDFIHHYRSLFKLHKPREELIIRNIKIDNLDYKHIRLQQVFKNIPVWDSELIVHINTDEVVYLAGGHYIPSPDKISLEPAFNETKALEYATKLLPNLKNHCSTCSATLIIYFDTIISPKLAYHIEASSKFSGSSQLILDAHTGELLTHIPRIHTFHQSRGWKTPEIKTPVN